MIKRFLFGLIAATATILSAQSAEVPGVIHDYYSAMKSMYAADINAALDYEARMRFCYSEPMNKPENYGGIWMKDCFFKIYEDSVSSYAFTKRFRENVNEKKEFKVNDYAPRSCKTFTPPDIDKKGEKRYTLVEVHIEVSDRSKSHTEYVTVLNNKISKIRDTEWSEDIQSLMVKAAKLYTEKKYNEAYGTYRRIISADPNNADAYYRLGVMTLRGQGVKKNISEARDLFYQIKFLDWKKSESLDFWDFYEIKTKAEYAIYYIDHPQSI